jgi:hypothetical protein
MGDVHHLQVRCWVKTPPRTGPKMLEMPNIEATIPVKTGHELAKDEISQIM